MALALTWPMRVNGLVLIDGGHLAPLLTELTQDPPGLELDIGAFTGGAQPGMGAVCVPWPLM